MSGDPNLEALEILRRDLTPEARSALAHLLNNAICPLVVEVAFPDEEVSISLLRENVSTLRLLVQEVLRP